MIRMLAAIVALAVAGQACGGRDDITLHFDNRSGSPVRFNVYYDRDYTGTLYPAQTSDFGVDFVDGQKMHVQVIRITDGRVVFDAVWKWGTGSDEPEPPKDIPITIGP